MQRKILKAVSEASGISEEQLLSKCRKKETANARGVYYALCRAWRLSPTVTGRTVKRKHGTAILTAKKYMGYIQAKDKTAVSLYEQAIRILNPDAN